MPYIQGVDRNQLMMCSLDCFVALDSIARIIDAFVGSLDLAEMGFARVKAATEGRPAYETEALLSLHLYGSRKGVRSSRKLDEACSINVEAKWLMNGLEPDFRTISDFRKDNIDCMKKVFKAFNKKLAEVLKQGFKSIDGSKFQASNSKDNNFTANKLDDRIEWLNQYSDEYLRQLEEMDKLDEETELSGQFTREEIEEKLQATQERLKLYKSYRDYMEESGLSQLSLTDPDAKLMKSKNGYMVSYNVQTVVDSETHLICDFLTTDSPTDHGLLYETMREQKEMSGDEIIEATADNGYQVAEDIVKCLENGIIPHVSLPTGQSVYELEMPHEENEITEEMKNSTTAENLKKCLRAGVIPTTYERAIEAIEVIEKRQLVRDNSDETRSPYGTAEEMILRAKLGFFVRDPERNIVYCPAGATLRQKSVKKTGATRYANKLACGRCKYRDKCIKGKAEWKEVDFHKDTLEKANQNWQKTNSCTQFPQNNKKRGHYEKIKIVKITFRPDRTKISERKCISEHPFGTIKRTMNASYFLLRGKKKVDGEVALMCLGYNMIVAKNLLGFDKLMEVMAA
jgi:transposase